LGERARQAEQGGFTGYEATIRRIQERLNAEAWFEQRGHAVHRNFTGQTIQAGRRNDVGEYRIVYDVQGDTLRVLVVGKRNDDAVYKALKRK
jgi:mRNA-degrading endonuclease RelE of RelBE toxin-antitoxin system